MHVALFKAAFVVLAVLVGGAWAQKAAPDVSPASGLQAMLEQRERAVWEAFKTRNRKAFTALVTRDYTAALVDGKGHRDLPAVLAAMKEITIHNYSLNDFKLTRLGPEAALLRYNAVANVAIGNDPPAEGKLAVSDLWVKRGGHWRSLYYQETEVK